MPKRSVEFVTLQFRSYASNTRLTEIFDIYMYKEPSVFVMNEFQHLILSEISCKNIIIVVLEDLYTDIIGE